MLLKVKQFLNRLRLRAWLFLYAGRGSQKQIVAHGSVGEYYADLCPDCNIQSGRFHITAVCRICGAPPAMDGKCICDWEHGNE